MKSNIQEKSVEYNANVEGNDINNLPGREDKASEGANVTDADTTRQQEMVDSKSNSEGFSVHQ